MSVPIKSAGSKSGVNCNRWKPVWMPAAIVFTVSVLARPGTPSSRMWPFASRPSKQAIDQVFLADHDAADLFAQRQESIDPFLHLLRDFLRRFHKKG